MKKHNYSAGPCILPESVFKKASQAVLDFNDSGLSLLEISHRSKDFVAVMDNAISLVKEILNVPEGYSVLFLQSGASMQFLMSAYNMLPLDGLGTYLNTGTWSDKAIKEAKKLGNIEVLASSKEANFNFIPKEYKIPENAAYFHYTSNNTIFGTQMKSVPETNVPLICDMSSDIFSKEIDVSKFDVIYAGAQKNLGPAGATLVIVKDAALGKTKRDIPSMLDYKIHSDKGSMFNTPPVFSIYTSMLTLEWLKEKGGIKAIQKVNQAKADLLYQEIDRNPLFKGLAAIEDRSNMNATFALTNTELESKFNEMWELAGINGLKGHRSVGGYRASMYNALPLESVEVLVQVMKELEKTTKS